jgi:hypothetical protein
LCFESQESQIVSKRKTVIRAIAIVGLCLAGCIRTAGTAAESTYPSVPTACFCEADPNDARSGHLGEVQPIPVERVLVIPVYKNFSEKEGLYLTIAHPFIYKQGDDLEKSLAAFGRREDLQKLVFWIPGYFPVHISRSFRDSGDVNGKRMVVEKVQRCVGGEEGQLNLAMKALLARKSFVIQEVVFRKRPPYSNTVTLTKDPYDFRRLVQSMGYESRYFKYGSAAEHHLWGTTVGTQIVNKFSVDEEKIVAAFAAEVMKKAKEGSTDNDKASSSNTASTDADKGVSPPSKSEKRN